MKKLISIILTLAMLLSMTTVIADEEIKICVDGEQVVFDAQPFIENDRTLVPMRGVFEAMGAEVTWDAENKTVKVKKELHTNYNLYTMLTIGNSSMDYYEEDIERGISTIKNEKVIELDVPAKIVGDRTFVPLRAISEEFEYSVEWNADTKTVTIESYDYTSTHYETYTEEIMSYLPKDENYVISPFSLQTAMMMAASGAEGETKNEIRSAFALSKTTQMTKVIEELNSIEEGEVNIANSIWFNKSIFGGESDFSDNFKKTIAETYYGNAETVTNDNSIETVNSWVEEQTNGRITDLLSEKHREFLTALVNTIYMKADWADEFNEHWTYEEVFTDINGKENEIEFMHQTDYFDYYEDNNTRAVRLPYTNGMSMYVVLGDVGNFENDIYYNGMDTRRIKLALPKFKIEYSMDFADILKKMGIKKAFEDYNPDFNLMVQNVPETIKIDSVLQKAIVEVDEKGTEAAAATAVLQAPAGALVSPDPTEIIEFKVNEPFTYFIQYDDRKETLFAGRYVKCES